MEFTSAIAQNELIIDDLNYSLFVTDPVINGEQMSRGRIPRDWTRDGFCSGRRSPFPSNMLIPPDEWDDRIKLGEQTKTFLSHLCDAAGLGVLNQDGTSSCWAQATVHTIEVNRVGQDEQLIRLSPASVSAPIKNFRDVGGWGSQALDYIIEHGIVPQDKWPPNSITNGRQYDTQDTRTLRDRFKVQEWWELRPRNMNELMSCLLLRIPVSVGLNWWAHQVCYMDPVAMGNGQYGARIDNSWGVNWGTNGRGILSGSRVLPDDAVAPRATTPYSISG